MTTPANNPVNDMAWPSLAYGDWQDTCSTLHLWTQVVGTVKLDTSGTFAATATLKDGPNAIGVTLLSGTDVVARSSYTVVLDRQPPSLSITRPREGETITGSNVIVEGRTETGATVSVNAQTVVPGPDGAFSATLPSSPGPLAITIIARDRAGNESTVKGTVMATATGPR